MSEQSDSLISSFSDHFSESTLLRKAGFIVFHLKAIRKS